MCPSIGTSLGVMARKLPSHDLSRREPLPFVLLGVTALLALSSAVVHAAELPALRVSENGRFFVTEEGKPFFWLGDTAWALFEKLNREDADFYLKDRASKGFTVIQAVLMFEGGIKPNAYGHPQLLRKKGGSRDATKPNEKYFEHVDYIVNKAESMGLYIGMIPVWAGTYVRKDRGLFHASNTDEARRYGKFLGTRYRHKPIIWILGGDYHPEGADEVWRQLAKGLAEGNGGTHLVTYHPGFGSSSQWFHNEDWLDFNMIQSGHSRRSRGYDYIAKDYALEPIKPAIDGEPGYGEYHRGPKSSGTRRTTARRMGRPAIRLLCRLCWCRRTYVRLQRDLSVLDRGYAPARSLGSHNALEEGVEPARCFSNATSPQTHRVAPNADSRSRPIHDRGR